VEAVCFVGVTGGSDLRDVYVIERVVVFEFDFALDSFLGGVGIGDCTWVVG
jgi:hypothetical protein